MNYKNESLDYMLYDRKFAIAVCPFCEWRREVSGKTMQQAAVTASEFLDVHLRRCPKSYLVFRGGKSHNGGVMTNYKIIGDERERELLGHIRHSQLSDDLPRVRTPDYHLDAEQGQVQINGLSFDFCWREERALCELDGGQWMPGGGRHNRDADRWKTVEAQARGWRVVHISYTMLTRDPARVLGIIHDILEEAMR